MTTHYFQANAFATYWVAASGEQLHMARVYEEILGADILWTYIHICGVYNFKFS